MQVWQRPLQKFHAIRVFHCLFSIDKLIACIILHPDILCYVVNGYKPYEFKPYGLYTGLSKTAMTKTDARETFEPAYVNLLRSGQMQQRVTLASRHLEDCDLCARYCHVNRKQTIDGAVCRTAELAVVHSFGPHHGEENPLRGWNGSGTIFFSWCNLRCVFCQNWDISQKGIGRETTPEQLAGMMLALQQQGCHNINFVSPSHVVAQIIAAVAIAAEKGLRLPLVYNTGGYDSMEALRLLDGVIDIYMPDMKYGDSAMARKYSKVRNYTEQNFTVVREMHRQVGDLVLDENGIALRGLLVRHLVLPNDIAGTNEVLGFIAREISTNTYINIMDQYRPCYRADDYPDVDRPVTLQEYQRAITAAHHAGLHRLDNRGAFGWL
jgi:putative pyruvate formate lyase activating enzyme